MEGMDSKTVIERKQTKTERRQMILNARYSKKIVGLFVEDQKTDALSYTEVAEILKYTTALIASTIPLSFTDRQTVNYNQYIRF